MCSGCRTFIIAGCIFLANLPLWADTHPVRQTVNLQLTSHLGDQQRFEQGDRVSFLLSLDRPAYVYLFYRDSEHNVIQLIPNEHQPQNHYQPGLFKPLPGAKAGFSFSIQAPFGEDRVWVFATDRQVEPLPGKTLPNGLRLMSLSIEDIRSGLQQQTDSIYDEASLVIVTENKSSH